MKKILVVEDSQTVTKVLKHLVKHEQDIEAYFADSYAAGQKLYEQHKDELLATIVDLHLPDAPNGETVDFFLGKGLPVIVLTANYLDETRTALFEKGIVDYVVKDSRYSYSSVFKLVHRLEKNKSIKILVTEDSKSIRFFIKGLLEKQLFCVLEASNGVEALKVLNENPDIKLLITDFNMPEMDGFELVKNIRQNIDKSSLVIIGLSAEGKSALSAKFVKHGANDFLAKPFFHEELYCRILHNIEELELKEALLETANRDYLTGIYNRRYFYEKGEVMHEQALDKNGPFAVAAFDIDHFKSINDTYGHHVGDEVLKFFARELEEKFSKFLVARTGGEEFCLILPGMNNEQAITLLDQFRGIVQGQCIPISHEEEFLSLTVSIGVSNKKGHNLNQQLSFADELLYRAKAAGRNIVIGDDE